MFVFSYILLPTLKKELENIENIRAKVLLLKISPDKEIVFKFESKIKIISSALSLSEIPIKNSEVAGILEGRKIENKFLPDVLRYKKFLDYVKRNWLLSEKNITPESIFEVLRLHDENIKVSKKEITKIENFISVNPENPIVQAGLALILYYNLFSQRRDAIKIALSISRLFLYKYGYDLRESLNLEEYFLKDKKYLEETINNAIKSENISYFLDYFVQVVSIQAEKILESLNAKKAQNTSFKNLYILTERQKKILSLFEKPGAKISNRDIQKEFRVSQITASRDLSRLVTLGLIFPHGRGRSIYYTII